MTKYTARNFLIAMFATGAVAFAYPALAQTLSELAESCSACHQYATHRSIQPMAAMLPGAIVRGRRPADVLSRRRAIVRLARSGSGEIFNQ